MLGLIFHGNMRRQWLYVARPGVRCGIANYFVVRSERINATLEACDSSDDIEIVPRDRIELGRLIGDVRQSINYMKSGRT